MKNTLRKLPGIGFRILSFIPVLNWISLLYIGLINSNNLNVICAIAYAVITFTDSSLSPLMWIVGIVHYAVAYRDVKKQIIDDTGKSTKQTMTTSIQKNTSVANGSSDVIVSGEKEYKQSIPARPSCASDDVKFSVSHENNSIANEFSDIVVSGEEEYKQSISVKPSHASEDARISISVHNPYTKFFTDMEMNASKEGKTAVFVPFMSYWPTYDSMNKAQQAWYFYWRSQVRKGNYMDTDLSYIFVLIYELLSGIGWQDPQDGYQKLMQLWAAYREKFPSLDRYLTRWTFDFTQQYNLEYGLSEVDENPLLAPSVMTDILIARHSEDVPLNLHFSLINALSDYSLVKSKFYKDGNQDLIHEAIPKVIALSDAALRKNKQKGILDTYGPPNIKKQEYYTFTSAVCPQANKKIYVTVKDYSTYPKLRVYIKELVRYGENTLRELQGYQGRLRGVTIDEETAQLIKNFLKEKYGQQATQENEPLKEPKVILDVEKIKKLRGDSDTVRAVLEVKETTIAEKKELLTEQANEPSKKSEVILDFENINTLRVQSDAVRTALEVKETIIPEKKELLTDIQEVTEIFNAISPSARSLLDRLEKSSWECSAAQGDEPLISEINRLSERYLGCALLVTEASKIIAEDDYRDELADIYQKQRTESSEGNSSKLFDSSVLTPEMKDFIDALLPAQQKALYVLLTSENPQGDLETIAEEALTMPQLLLDEINELARQRIGDFIVETEDQKPHIFDEHIDLLKKSVA